MFKSIFFAVTLSLGLNAFAHGEDVPGPHGGHIQMPANFHTEVVPEKNGKSFKVYLIDLQFKNPLTQKSEVKAQIGDQVLKCTVKEDYFRCTGAKNLKSGSIVIQATRDGVVAQTESKYELPFKAFKSVPAKTEDHSMHH